MKKILKSFGNMEENLMGKRGQAKFSVTVKGENVLSPVLLFFFYFFKYLVVVGILAVKSVNVTERDR